MSCSSSGDSGVVGGGGDGAGGGNNSEVEGEAILRTRLVISKSIPPQKKIITPDAKKCNLVGVQSLFQECLLAEVQVT